MNADKKINGEIEQCEYSRAAVFAVNVHRFISLSVFIRVHRWLIWKLNTGEVIEHLQTGAAAFFGVKLNRHHVVAFDGRAEFQAMLRRCCDDFRIVGDGEKRMDEVHHFARRDIFK